MTPPLSPPRQPLTTDQGWRRLSVYVLEKYGLPYKLANWIEFENNIFRLDDLCTWWQTHQTAEIKGISEKEAAAIDAAVTRFWDAWTQEHK
jgi:hypothetical protein